jgi:K+-sensing histidine kinase KdpD
LLPSLFNKFVTKSNKEGEHGSGLGLYISKGIVEAHGGSISVKNNQGAAGCTFTIALPIREEQIVTRMS